MLYLDCLIILTHASQHYCNITKAPNFFDPGIYLDDTGSGKSLLFRESRVKLQGQVLHDHSVYPMYSYRDPGLKRQLVKSGIKAG